MNDRSDSAAPLGDVPVIGGPPRPIRLVICWMDVTGYMAACWRELAGRRGIELWVLATGASGSKSPFNDSEVMQGVRCQLVTAQERDDAGVVSRLVIERRPDVIVLCGWAVPAYVALSRHPALTDCRFIVALDTPWRGTLRQRFGGVWMRRFLQRMDAAIVAGERSAVLARELGLPPRRICRGMYGIDAAAMSAAATTRPQGDGWPRRFLYLGRYAPEKGIQTLVDAYREYRRLVRDPWPLTCAGSGPLAGKLREIEGITDRGFVQPTRLPALLAEHGVLLLPSRYEPWGAALAEACASGLPVIATDACGAALDVVRSFHNGLLIPTDDVPALVRSLIDMHTNHERLPIMGERSRQLAEAFSAQRWADRWQDMIRQLSEAPSKSQPIIKSQLSLYHHSSPVHRKETR